MYKGNIVITGASTGIGKFTAAKFCREGYQVFGSVRKEKDAEAVSADLGPAFVPLIFDVTDHKAVRKASDFVSNTVGDDGIALLMNNAGIAVTGPTEFMHMDDYRHQFEVNFFGLIATTQAFLPQLKPKGAKRVPGKIFNISSVAGQMSYPFMGPYSASKHAVEGLSKALRRELMIYGIDVIIIGPGAIKTPIWNKTDDLEEEVLQSAYGEIIKRFKREIMKEAKGGMEVMELADKIFDIFIDNRPKTRYSILNQKFTKYILPRYILPDRIVDGFIRKNLFKMN